MHKSNVKSTGQKEASFKEYTCRYFHDGSWWALSIRARDNADAQARVDKLGNLQLLGEVMAVIPAKVGAGLLVRALCSVRNFFV